MYQRLAVAVACSIEFERCCQRFDLLDEYGVVRFAAQYMQANWQGIILSNQPHGDLTGKFVDLVGTRPRTPEWSFALEAKFVRHTTGVREWLAEVALDVFRLQHLSTNAVQSTDRIVLLAGQKEQLHDHIFHRLVNTNGARQRGLPMVLPEHILPAPSVVEIRNSPASHHRWFKKLQEGLGADLPISYTAHLAGRYQTGQSPDSIEVCVWVTRRRRNWHSFDASSYFA